MTKSKARRALLSSVMAMILCMAMFIGTTYAWFTDSATTGVNRIQAGNLDVALEVKDEDDEWVNAEGITLDFVSAAPGQPILWEPGCTYSLPDVRVANNGTLAIKFKVSISGIDGDAKLNEVIDWSFTDEDGNAFLLDTWYTLGAEEVTKALTLSGHMREDAGNEYQGLTLGGIAITVFATQAAVEEDSFGNDYDKDAPVILPAGVTEASFGTNVAYYNGTYYADFQDAINAVTTSGTIYLKPGHTFQGIVDGASTKAVYTISGGRSITLELNGSTFEYQMQYPASGAGNMSIFSITAGNLTINGDGKMVVSNTADAYGANCSTAIFYVGNAVDSSLTINGGSYFAKYTKGSSFTILAIVDITNIGCRTLATINGGYFYSDDTIIRNFYAKGAASHVDLDVVINGGTFVAGDTYGRGYRGWIWNQGATAYADADCSADITINDGKYINVIAMNYQFHSVASRLGITINDIDAGSTLYARNNKGVISNDDYWVNCTINVNPALNSTVDGAGKITITK